MSIPDDPFQTSTSTSTATSAPALHVHTADSPDPSQPTAPPDGERISPASGGSPNSTNISPPTHTPGGGGLAPPSGGKTPRRVQWTNESHIVQLQPLDRSVSSPAQTLDEHNIDQVRDALERHRRRPPSHLSLSSSHEPSEPGDAEEDYDYRLDVDPPQRPELGERRDSENDVDLFDNGMRDHVATYIAPGERDGLPNISTMQSNDADAAKDLVRAHTGKWGVLRRRVRGAGAVKGAFGTLGAPGVADPEKPLEALSAEQDAFAARYPEPRRPSVAMPGGAPGGASVLSSLLALYGQQDGMESGTTTAASSRPTSEDGDSSDEERRRSSDKKGHRHSWIDVAKKNKTTSATDTPANGTVNDAEHPAVAEPRSKHSAHSHKKTESPGISSFFQKAKDQIQYTRPQAAKSGAGVFGALVQSTASMAGAATPAGSTLAPAAKRPGYQLNRYSMPDANAEIELERTTTPWRPHSRPTSRAGSRPASTHSSTAVSRDGDSPTEPSFQKKAISTDDLVSLRQQEEKKKRKSGLFLENLGSLPVNALKEGGKSIKNAEKWLLSAAKTPLGTPPEKGGADYFGRPLTEDERRRKEWEAEKKRRKKARDARKKQEIFIIQHVAAILARQQFLMKLARALMMFGSPSHRLETQIQATAKVLEINAQVVYLPGTMLISFGDDATHTSETKFLKQASGLDLGKLLATHHIYWNVVHDKMSVEQASKDLDVLMTTPVYYNWWQTLLIGGFASSFITVTSFYGSFIDALMAFPIGVMLCGTQMLAARNDMFSNVFEIAVATIISFISAALASTQVFCYTALVSGGVVLILPGYIVLCGALELASRNITAGAVRIGYSVIYSLFLGFGISIGAVLYEKITGLDVIGASDYTCATTHDTGAWYTSTPSQYWYFLTTPGFSLMLALRNQQPLFAKELPIMWFIALCGWTSNHFSSLAFPGRSDLTSAIGSFVVGTLGSIYGKFSNGSSFPVTVVGILFQLPSGLSNGGIFNFAAESSDGSSTAYSDGFSVAEQLVAVAIGLTVGLFVSAAVMHPFGGGRRRGSGIFAF